MTKFCKNCGRMATDTDTACTQCGKLLEAPQKDAADRLFQRIGLVIGVIVLATIVANIIGANTGYRGTIKKMVKAFEDNNTAKLVSMASGVGEDLCESWGISDYDDYCEDMIEDARDRLVDEVGAIKKITYRITGAEKMDKDRINEAKEYFDAYNVRFSPDKVYTVSVELTIKGAKETTTTYQNFLVLKENGEWKLYRGAY